jgi:hypothetical protein
VGKIMVVPKDDENSLKKKINDTHATLNSKRWKVYANMNTNLFKGLLNALIFSTRAINVYPDQSVEIL